MDILLICEGDLLPAHYDICQCYHTISSIYSIEATRCHHNSLAKWYIIGQQLNKNKKKKKKKRVAGSFQANPRNRATGLASHLAGCFTFHWAGRFSLQLGRLIFRFGRLNLGS